MRDAGWMASVAAGLVLAGLAVATAVMLKQVAAPQRPATTGAEAVRVPVEAWTKYYQSTEPALAEAWTIDPAENQVRALLKAVERGEIVPDAEVVRVAVEWLEDPFRGLPEDLDEDEARARRERNLFAPLSIVLQSWAQDVGWEYDQRAHEAAVRWSHASRAPT